MDSINKYVSIVWNRPEILEMFNNDNKELRPSWLTQYPTTYNWMYEGYKKGVRLTEEQLIKLLKKDGVDDDVIFDIISYDGNDLDHDMVMAEIKQEATQFALTKAFDLADNNKLDSLEDIISLYKKYVPDTVKKEEDIISISKVDDIYSTLDDVFTEESHIASGWNNMDSLTGGWYIGDTHCIVAGSGIGKSIILANIARRSIESGYSVLYITTEMNNRQQLQRIYKSYFNAKSKDEITTKLTSRRGVNFPISVIKVHPNSTTTLDIKAMAAGKKFDILIIDYMDELRATEKTKDEYEKHRILGTDLKKLAEELNVPLITASQTNRSTMEGGSTKAYVGLEAIGDSWNKVKALSFVYTVVQTEGMKSNTGTSAYILSLQKSRYTGKGLLFFSIDYSTMRLEELRDNSDMNILLAATKKEEVVEYDEVIFSTKLEGEMKQYFERLKDKQDTYIADIKELYKEKKITSKEKMLLIKEITSYNNAKYRRLLDDE